MILNYESVDMDNAQNTEKFLEKTYAVVKKSIDNEDIKTQVYSVSTSKDAFGFPEYVRVSLNRKKYDIALEDVMDYFIRNEWYEDCAEVRDYQTKLKRLLNNEQQTTKTKPEPVEAEL